MSEERKAFEAWAKERNNGKDILKCHDSTYANHESEWAAWQAGVEFLRRNGEPEAYLVTTRGHGTRRQYATLPGYSVLPDEELIEARPLFAAPQPLPSEELLAVTIKRALLSAPHDVNSNTEDYVASAVYELLKGKK